MNKAIDKVMEEAAKALVALAAIQGKLTITGVAPKLATR